MPEFDLTAVASVLRETANEVYSEADRTTDSLKQAYLDGIGNGLGAAAQMIVILIEIGE